MIGCIRHKILHVLRRYTLENQHNRPRNGVAKNFVENLFYILGIICYFWISEIIYFIFITLSILKKPVWQCHTGSFVCEQLIFFFANQLDQSSKANDNAYLSLTEPCIINFQNYKGRLLIIIQLCSLSLRFQGLKRQS